MACYNGCRASSSARIVQQSAVYATGVALRHSRNTMVIRMQKLKWIFILVGFKHRKRVPVSL